MDEWLTLTEEDIARAYRLTKDHPLMPEIIILTPDDVAPNAGNTPTPTPSTSDPLVITIEELSPSPTLTPETRTVALSGPLQITEDDLTPTTPQPQVTDDIRQLEVLLYNLVKAERAKHLPAWVGTAELIWDETLAAVARGHSHDMLRRQYVAHVSPEGVTASQRLDGQGVSYIACGENIGIVYGEASHGSQGVHEIHNAFMNQPRSLTNHRGNVLNPIWTHVGIGIAYSADGSLVATQNFISAPGAKLRGE